MSSCTDSRMCRKSRGNLGSNCGATVARRGASVVLIAAVLLGTVFIPACLVPVVWAQSNSEPDSDSTPKFDLRAVAEFAADSPTLARWSPMLDAAGLDTLVAGVFDAGLAYMEMAPWELGFEKRYVRNDTFRLSVIDRILEDPLALPAWQAKTVAVVRRHASDSAGLFAELGRMADAPVGSETGPKDTSSSDETEHHSAGSPDALIWAAPALWPNPQSGVSSGILPFEEAVEVFVQDLDEVTNLLDRAFARVDSGERERILMEAAVTWGREEDLADITRKGMLQFEAATQVDTTVELSLDVMLDAAARVDRDALTESMVLYLAAARRLTRSVWSLLPRSDDRDDHRDDRNEGLPFADKVGGQVVASIETDYGAVLVGGTGNNTYPASVLKDAAFVFDLGGDDVYRGRGASAVGGLFATLGLIVDAGGDDFYDARSHPYALGGALFGLAALIDLGGDDVYRGDDGSLGAGFFGCGLLLDQSGRDEFEGRNFCEGAGSVGLGVLISSARTTAPPGPELNPDFAYEAGLIAAPGTGSIPIRYDENDRYSVALNGQGFASTFGVGLLYDTAGNDLYQAGGRYPHAPLLADDFQSFAQGFSIGWRPRAAGGLGILMDEAGNDTYNAEVFAQGTSYFYSIGFLFDGGGNDRYHATQYAQGAGVHLAIGSLWDRGGDDQYVSKNGVVQGFAHDLSVALFVDESGRDYYTVSDGQGTSLTNSVAIFIDGHGDDIYATSGGGRGEARYRRGFSGAAFFADLEGTDTYPGGKDALDGTVWASTNYSIGIDLDRDVEFPGEEIPEIILTAADSVRAIDELFETASLWEVGSDREKVRRARSALKVRGMEAVNYATGRSGPYPDGEPLTTRAGLVYRTLRETARAYPDSFAACLLPRLLDADEQIQRNSISLLGDLKSEQARVPLEALLADDSQEVHRNRVIQALGRIALIESAGVLRPFLSDEKETRRLATLVALKAIRDSASVSSFVAAMADSEMTVRSAALSVVRSLGERSIPDLLHDLGGDGPDPYRAAKIKALGMIGIALKDSTCTESVAAREQVLATLLAEVDRLREEDTQPWPLNNLAASASAARAAAISYLMRFDDEVIAARVQMNMEREFDPLVLRSYARAQESAAKRAEE